MSTTNPPAPEPTEGGNSRSGLLWVCMLLGLAAFVLQLFSSHPEKAWQAYLTNFLLFSAIAQGGLLFSVIMHITKARWSGPLANLAEAFTAFFPLSIGLFLLLFIGQEHIFPWLHMDLHGKEVWLNVPFLFGRDLGALLLLYLTGLLYLYHGLWFKLRAEATGDPPGGGIQRWLLRRWQRRQPDEAAYRRRQMFFALIYALFFALVLSLIGYDLVMAMDPHWYSTLFGAYSFVKAFYVGLGAIIIAAALLQNRGSSGYTVTPDQYHDIGKLFFAFCLVWADFFYAQFVVIWYGNISEETSYIIQRTMTAPWNILAWTVLIVCFIGPFLILLNKGIKTRPRAMLVICSTVIIGIWLEHKLLLGPAFAHGAGGTGSPFSLVDFFIPLGFLGLMVKAVNAYLRQFPQLLRPPQAPPRAVAGAAVVEEVV
jgi:Ni/Fe-hydrogenase subunit HybB-like protein